MAVTISTEKLTIGYRTNKGDRVIEEGISLTLNAGELNCLIGPNGAGKSTLMKTLSGFLPPLSGDVVIEGKPLQSYSGMELAKTVSVVLTERLSVENMTVRELVGLGRSPYADFWGSLSSKDKEVVAESLNLVGISELSERNVVSLSDGERQKAMIAKAIAQETPVIILDEPTAFLDYPSKAEIMKLLKSLAISKNKTVFLSTHDLEIAFQIADRLILMDNDHGVTAGATAQLAANGTLNRYFDKGCVRFDAATMRFLIS